MSDDKNDNVIIIKRIIKKQPHHGGAWKIAYADFVTAMMAFFMLMWLLSMLNKFQLQGISNYFKKPMKDVFVDNQKNDLKIPKPPDEQTKKYKLVPLSSVNNKNQSKTHKETDNAGFIKAKYATPASVNETYANPAKINAKFANPAEKEAKKPNQGDSTEELEKLKELKKHLESSLNSQPEIKQYKDQLNFQLMPDGLKIQLHELENKPMFSLGKADFEKYASKIIKWLSTELNTTPNKITVIGHTDSQPYPAQKQYSNWELSTERANSTRQLLVKHGMKPNKIIRIQGAADVNLLDKIQSENPINRRIEIIILTNDAAKKMMKQ